jgi:cell division protein ZapA
MSNSDVQGVNVEIFGERYPISSEGDAAEVQRIAAFVDKKMREIADLHAGRLSTSRVAVLTAMELTVELFRAMQERNQLTARAHENLDRLTKLIEDRADMSQDRSIPSFDSRASTLLQETPISQQE